MKPLLLPYLLTSIVLSGFLAFVCFRRPPARLWPILPVSFGLALVWSVGALASLVAIGLWQAHLASLATYTGTILGPVAAWLLALRFSETYGIPSDQLERPWLPCLYAYAGAMCLIVATNPFHGQFLTPHPLGERPDFHWAFWLHASLAHALSVGVAVFYVGIRRRHRSWAVRRKSTIMAAAYLLPPVVSFVHLFAPSPSSSEPTLIAVPVSALLVLVGVYRRGLFNPLPVAVREILEHDSQAILVTDDSGHLLFANSTGRDLLGSVGMSGDVDVFPYLAPRLQQPSGRLAPLEPAELKRRLAARDQPVDGHLFRFGRGGEEWARVRSVPIRDADDVILARSVRVENLTGCEEAQALRQLTDELARSNLDLEEFAYTASHELRVPLWMMRSLARSVEEEAQDVLSPKCRDYLRRLQARAAKMDDLVERLLAYSQVGQSVEDRMRVDVRELLESIVAALAPPAGLSVELVEPLPVLHTSRVALERVLSNLVANAIRHHDRGDGTVEVSARDVGSLCEFSVRDDGPGIDAVHHQRIFGMRQTLEDRECARTAGIGLALVRKQVLRFGGEVRVESCVGEGATFRFTWPKKPESTDTPAAA